MNNKRDAMMSKLLLIIGVFFTRKHIIFSGSLTGHKKSFKQYLRYLISESSLGGIHASMLRFLRRRGIPSRIVKLFLPLENYIGLLRALIWFTKRIRLKFQNQEKLDLAEQYRWEAEQQRQREARGPSRSELERKYLLEAKRQREREARNQSKRDGRPEVGPEDGEGGDPEKKPGES
jgi:hypothetical protein